MRNGDWSLFGMHTECAQRRSSRRGKRPAPRPGGSAPKPKEASTPAASTPASDTEVPESVAEILASARTADEAHRARLEARITELERELREARAVAATVVATADKPDLGFQDLQATLAAQQEEQHHREALDLFLVEAQLRADDESRLKSQLEAPGLIPTLVDVPTAPVPVAPSVDEASAVARPATDLGEELDSAALALEAAEARAAHNAQQVKRLTEELMAARQEQMRTAARLRDLEDRLSKAEDRAGFDADATIMVAPQEIAAAPDPELSLSPALEEEQQEETAAPEAQTEPELDQESESLEITPADLEPDTLEELQQENAETSTPDGLLDDIDSLPEEFAPELDEIRETTPSYEDETEESDDIFGAPGEMYTVSEETPPAAKSPVDALADVLSAWDDAPGKPVDPPTDSAESAPETAESGLSVEEPSAEPDIADALASWSRGELEKPSLPALEDFVLDMPTEELSSTETEASSEPDSGVSLEDALANWGATETEETAEHIVEDDTAEAAVEASDDHAPSASEPVPDPEETTTTEAADIAEDDAADATTVVEETHTPDAAALVEETASETPEEEEDIFGFDDPVDTSDDPDLDADSTVASTPVELVDDDVPESNDFDPEPEAAPSPTSDAPIAARARDNATKLNENLQQWSGLGNSAARREDATPRATRPMQVAASADESTATTEGSGKREQGKKAMVDALLKFMGPR